MGGNQAVESFGTVSTEPKLSKAWFSSILPWWVDALVGLERGWDQEKASKGRFGLRVKKIDF